MGHAHGKKDKTWAKGSDRMIPERMLKDERKTARNVSRQKKKKSLGELVGKDE